MSDIAIKVENLSKSYRIRRGEAARYTALRDVMAEQAAQFFKRMAKGRNPFSQPNQHETFWALDDVSFEVKQGEVMGVIGRNGAGKSTLLKILSRITEPDKGRITLNGRVASLLEVGTGFHPELTGLENIFLSRAILGMKREEIKKRFDEIVDFAGVEKFLDTPVKRYSSGMYVRLGFAVAAHLETEILLVDEVLAVGDVEFQRRCIERMKDYCAFGKSVITVSHNLSVVDHLCNSAMVLAKGGVANRGDVKSCINHYKNFNIAPKIKKDGLNSKLVISFLVNGKEDEECKFGDEIEILVQFDDVKSYVGPVLGIVIKDENYRKVISINNKMYGQFMKRIDGGGIFRFRCKCLFNIPAGYYSLDLHLGDENGDFCVLNDVIRFSFIQEFIQFGHLQNDNQYILPLVEWDITD